MTFGNGGELFLFGAKENTDANAYASDPPGMAAENFEVDKGKRNEVILVAIKDLKADFSARLDSLLATFEVVRNDMKECMECVTTAEGRISNVEDNMASLQAKVQLLEEKKSELEDKVTDLKARSRHSNLRVTNLLEGIQMHPREL